MARVRLKNTFSKGMSMDVDRHRQPDGFYRYGKNVRVMFNPAKITNNLKAGNERTLGNTFAITSMRGNTALTELPNGYTLIDSCDMEDYAVVFLNDGVNSELGIVTVNGVTNAATYETLFNDASDPNGDRLNFHDAKYIQSIGIIESPTVQRVHFVDGVNVPRVVNVPLYDTGTYDWWKSVHGMSYRAEVNWGLLKYVRTIETGGGLKSGMYQYSYRYITADGQDSVWFPLTPHLFITTQKMFPDGSTLLDNHHEYYMDASEVQTTHRVLLLLEGVDTRFKKVEFAYVYWTTDTAPKETRVFLSLDIDPNVANLTISHDNHGGIPISFDEFQTTYKNIRSAKGVGMHDNVLWYGGIVYEDQEKKIDTSLITIEPKTRPMRSDELGNENFHTTGYPLTNSTAVNTDIQIQAYLDGTSTPVYNIWTNLAEEYRNYKGNLWQQLFKGYWRGETYPYAIVLWDNLGQPCFAQHIQDYTFAEQFDIPTTDGVSTLDLELLGAVFSGISLTSDILFRDGKLIVSGFSVVRADRLKSILHQGIITPCIQTADETDSSILGYPDNKFIDPDKEDADYEGIWERPDNSTPEHHRSACVYSSPDVCVEERIIDPQESHYLKIVNAVRPVFDTGDYPDYDVDRGTHVVPSPDLQHVYDKYYLNDPSIQGQDTANVGQKSRIRISTCITKQYEKGIGKFIADLDPEDLDLDMHPIISGRWNDSAGGDPYDNDLKRSRIHYNAVWMRTRDINRWDAGYGANDTGQSNSDGKWRRYFIANYTVPKTDYYAQGSGVSTRIYYPTGHFQPINAAVLADVPSSTSGGITTYIFNGVEVWGGDCFLDYWDFLRNYPVYDECSTEASGAYRDSSIGMIVPIESNYNMAMRLGRKYANVCVYPEAAACGTSLPYHRKGINLNQPEDWNVNSCLQAKYIYPTFSEKSKDITVNNDALFSFAYSLRKVYGERFDSHRKLLPNNGGDAEGIQGDFVAFAYANNYMYFFQQRGFGFILTRERTAVSGSDGVPIYLGTGADFGGVQYISRTHGTQHPKSVVSFRNNIFATDARSNTFLKFSQAGLDELSDNNGLHDFAVSVLPLWGNGSYAKEAGAIQAGVDQENYEILTSFTSGGYEVPSGYDADVCLRYNILLGAFVSDDSTYPTHWMKYGKYLLTASGDALWIHNRGRIGRFYGTYYQSKLRFIVTGGDTSEVTFDNMQINCNAAAKDRILSVYTRTENTNDKDLTLIGDPRVRYRIDNLRFPLREDTAGVDRCAGQFLDVELTIDNAIQEDDEEDIQVVITSIETDVYTRTNRQ